MIRPSSAIAAALLALGLGATAAHAAPSAGKNPAPLFPTELVLAGDRTDYLYPSVAGEFLAYNRRAKNHFDVIRTSRSTPTIGGVAVEAPLSVESLRYGVALADGSIGYVSDRLEPSTWIRQARGDGHISIANMGSQKGGLLQLNPHASWDGRIWAFETALDHGRRAKLANEYANVMVDHELIGQNWRQHNSDCYRIKVGYSATKSGNSNEFPAPVVFIFDRNNSQLTMIPDAFNAAISPDGKKIVFVRQNNGNYDLWMQDVDGGDLVQLTDTPFGEFEPAFSPDGKRIAFVSNRDSEGNVRATSIYILDLANGKTTRLTNAAATDGGPAWRNDHTVLFHSDRDPKKPQENSVGYWSIWQVSL